MTRLLRMSQSELDSYLVTAIPEFAADKVVAGQLVGMRRIDEHDTADRSGRSRPCRTSTPA